MLLGAWKGHALPSLPEGLQWGKEGLKVLGVILGFFVSFVFFWTKLQCKREVSTHTNELCHWPCQGGHLTDAQEQGSGFCLRGAGPCLEGFAQSQAEGGV